MRRILSLLFLSGVVVFNGSIKQELREIKRKLSKVKKELGTLSTKERNILKEIELLDEKLKLTKKLVVKLRELQKEKIKEIDSLQRTIESIEDSLSRRKEDLKKRIFFIYKKGKFFDIELILGAEDVSSFYYRYMTARMLAREDRKKLKELRELKQKVERDKKELEDSYKELAKVIIEKRMTEDSLKMVKKRVKRRLADVKRKKKEKEKLKKELELAKKRLLRMLENMESKRGKRRTKPGTHYVERKKGNLPWPCKGKIISYFGKKTHPKYGTVTRNDGIDIKCSKGTKVKAISAGRVAFADRYLGYGNLVIIDHGDGFYSIYANLDEIYVSQGKKVVQGEVIGRVDDYLHFEFRVNAKPQNPLLWLR